MFLLPLAWTNDTGLPLEARIPELWDTLVLVMSPIPGPTRMADPNRAQARDYLLGLIDLFFLRAELVPVVI